MLAFAKSEKELSKPQKDGATLRQHYEMAEKSGRKCPELIQPEIPKQIRYILHWYGELKLVRLSWQEIKAWAEMTNRKPNDWEIATLLAIDRVINND